MTAWAGRAAQFTWRPSQVHVLELAGHVNDRRWHLCAPPGAELVYAGEPRATQLVLAAARGRPDVIGRRQGWRPGRDGVPG